MDHAAPSAQPGPSPVASRHPDIAALVAHFYARARADALLGPVFAHGVADWPQHLRAITAFWAAQLRGRGTYQGQPMAAHLRHAGLIRPEMFARWLALWEEETAARMAPEDAARLQEKARRIAEVLQRALAGDGAR
ncbi:MAG TPA: group III truncated hemoglobin [Novosphingobium sp.]|nr:group III truncated hemoglobin [Novosphingobium sp.]